MAWLPENQSDNFWFAVAPLTTIPFFVYGASGYISGDYRYGKPDWQSNIRNAAVWGGLGGSVYLYNLLVHPGKYGFVSAGEALKFPLHMALTSPALPAAILGTVAVGSAAGYVATSDVHKGATGMLVGDMNMGVPVSPESASWIENPPTWREFLGID